ncbi:MAG: biotin transporter BioY [Clostridia bacterium]|nr:biotin transporter BioY [Clostridia bacterium]
MTNNKDKIHRSALIIAGTAMFTALICICSWITVPLWGIPITLQVFAVSTALLTAGGKTGTLSIIIYVILGAVGLPVYSGFGGGFGVLFGPTGGYIFGFILTGAVYALAEAIFKNPSAAAKVLFLAAGLIICYAFGTAQFYIICVKNGYETEIMPILLKCVFPFIIPDFIKILFALRFSALLKKYMRF